MQIAVSSGKGGTGKTTIATSLALSLVEKHTVWFVDCDVEAPNGHLFLQPVFHQEQQAVVQIPQIQASLCSLCGKCVEVCQFHALAKVGKTVLVFPQLCHGCGSCTWNCPEKAIQEIPNPIGVLEAGLTKAGVSFSRGLWTISEPMPTPLIRQLKKWKTPADDAVVIYDSPPGASCAVVETLRGADFALLVTEPTPFGLHDLKQVVGVIREMGVPGGVIINRENGDYPPLFNYCSENRLPVLMRIPYSRVIASGVAEGKPLIDIYPQYVETFQKVYHQIQVLTHERTSQHSKGEEYIS